jgi:Ni,Fe-hydrogenase maturation factor
MSNRFKLTTLFILLFIVNVFSQKKEYFDGPYIDIIKDSIRIRWVEEGYPHDSIIAKQQAFVFDRPNLQKIDLNKLEFFPEKEWEFPNIEKYVVLGDPHGQYDKMHALLKANKIIDSLDNWNFENNHLVVMGDYFGRGDKVMEVLWLLFKLEQQASAANGHVHILIGNHDIMTLDKDLRYLNAKYLYSSGALKTYYTDLFSETSVLGNWLRSKNIGIVINDHLLVHGGASTDLTKAGMDLEHLNDLMKNQIFSKLGKDSKYSPIENLVLENSGPFWYRGYSDSTYINEIIVDSILEFYNVHHVIVGHTITNEIKHKFDGKIIFVDCGLFAGNEGELLKYNKNEFSKLSLTGIKTKLFENTKHKKVSIYQYLYNQEGVTTLSIKTDLKDLIKNKLKEVYQEANLEISNNGNVIQLNGKIRARGNIRKHVCYLPPVKFSFNKSELHKYDLKSADKLKLVFPCRNSESNQEKLLLEYFIYTLYQLIDSNSIRAKLVDINVINDNNKVDQTFKGLAIEDEMAYSLRKHSQLLPEKGVINSKSLDRTSFVRMYFFQYMIGNTDWSIANRHNVLITKLLDENKLIVLPYDFDYSGFVNQSYAVPHESLPIKTVTERHFMSYPITESEFEEAVAFYTSKKEEILEFCRNTTYLKPKSIKENVSFIEDFFTELEKPKNLRRSLRIE